MAIHRIVVRMYRRLLGDCFLIRIEDAGSNRHILIDCGLLQGLDKAGERMTAIARDIALTCDGRLDLLVVTHEHWDHISGFQQAKDIFFDKARLQIDRLWMAWTEKPGDPDADRLRARFDDRKQALTAFARAVRPGAAPGAPDVLRNLDRFIGPSEPGPAANGLGVVPTGRLTGRRIMTELQAAAIAVDFLEPGQVLTTPGADPLRVAVLGPPRTEARLFKDLPSRGAAKETYLAEECLLQSLLGVDGDFGETETIDTSSPFPQRYHRYLSRAEVEKARARDGAAGHSDVTDAQWLNDRYFADKDFGEKRPQDDRRIDDIAGSAAGLALKLDSDTNNTSLVLAFELPDQTFMLFAADAQVGNWLSWHDQDYGFGSDRLSAEQILARTRLYKVGHHGSHNATLDRKGLAMMTHADLVAMVSTVEAEALDQGSKGWEMPDRDVATALYRQCRGRVLVGDRDWASDTLAAPHQPDPAFARALDESLPLYVEYTVFPPATA